MTFTASPIQPAGRAIRWSMRMTFPARGISTGMASLGRTSLLNRFDSIAPTRACASRGRLKKLQLRFPYHREINLNEPR